MDAYIPLYRIANAPALVYIMSRHPAVRVVAAINPPPNERGSQQPRFVQGIDLLQSAGATVLYYVATLWGERPLNEVYLEMEQAALFYPNIQGFMFDEAASGVNKLCYYASIRRKVQALGFDYMKLNPGTQAARQYFTIGVENVSIAEGQQLPTEAYLVNATYPGVPQSQFSITIFNQPVLDRNYVYMAAQYLGLLYITNDTLPNPYDDLPPYLEELFSILETTA